MTLYLTGAKQKKGRPSAGGYYMNGVLGQYGKENKLKDFF
jgi:hypothetical protein